MMLYRSLVVGLLGAIAMLVAARPPAPVASAPTGVAEPALAAPRDTLVDARLGAGPVLGLLGLAPREHIVAIDDVGCSACEEDLEARWRLTVAREYLDVTVATPRGERRVLVLAHPAIPR